jgi:hypothetical protein
MIEVPEPRPLAADKAGRVLFGLESNTSIF